MAKKWMLSLKVGLFRDPKHRRKMREGIWLFGYLIDNANWDTGIVTAFTDQDCAQELDVSVAWVRKWRRLLEREGYITSRQDGQHSQEIVIHRWVNPRQRDATPLNVPVEGDTERSTLSGESGAEGDTERSTLSAETEVEGDTERSTLTVEGDTQGDTQGDTERVTLHTLDSDDQESDPSLNPPQKKLTAWQEQLKAHAIVLCEIAGANYELNKKRAGQIAGQLIKAGYTIEKVREFEAWWYREDWRGQKRQRPSLNQIQTDIGRAFVPPPNGHRNARSSLDWVEPTEEQGRAIARAILQAEARRKAELPQGESHERDDAAQGAG